jgi:hypothetical protein
VEITTDIQTKLDALRDAAAEFGGASDEVQPLLEAYHASVLAAGSTTEVWLPDMFIQFGPPDWSIGYADVNGWCIAIRDSTGFVDPNDDTSPRTWAAPVSLLDSDRSRRYPAIHLQNTLLGAMIV